MNKIWSKLSLASLILCVWVGNTASASADQGPVAGKPAAEIGLVDLDPVRLTPGEVQRVTVELMAPYPQGEMRVKVSAAEPLEVLGGAQSFYFDLAGGGPYALPLELYLPVAGRYYLNIAVELDSSDAEINFRALAVIVDAGEGALEAPQSEPPTRAGSGKKIHSLPAQEQVKPVR